MKKLLIENVSEAEKKMIRGGDESTISEAENGNGGSGGGYDCICDCDSPPCADPIWTFLAATGGAAASWLN